MSYDSNRPIQQPTALPKSNLALASLILGILGWTAIPFLGSLGAIVTGHMAKKEIKNSPGTLGGDGMATAGLVLGYINAALFVCTCLTVLILTTAGLLTIPVFQS